MSVGGIIPSVMFIVFALLTHETNFLGYCRRLSNEKEERLSRAAEINPKENTLGSGKLCELPK